MKRSQRQPRRLRERDGHSKISKYALKRMQPDEASAVVREAGISSTADRPDPDALRALAARFGGRRDT